jgi:hypothetical protein
MTKIKIIALFLIAVLVFSLCSCKISLIEPEDRTLPTISTNESDGEEGQREYPVTKYKLADGAIELSGPVNRYIYADLDGADKVIDTLNGIFDIDLKIDETINFTNGYSNWFWDNGEGLNAVSASVSMSSKTGKFSFYYKPDNNLILTASQAGGAEEEKLLEKATDFVNKFSFVTGELKFEYSEADNDLYYPLLVEGATDSEDFKVSGRTFYFTSEKYSRQKLDVNSEITNCYVECGNSNILMREVQYFVVTLFPDGTVVSADNYITKAPILSNGTVEMIDESKLNTMLEYFTSTTEDDTLLIKRIYVNAYSNYFGYPEINPFMNIEYSFASDPDNIQLMEFSFDPFI